MLLVSAGGLRVDYLITREGEAHIGLPGGNALFAAAGARLWNDSVAVWSRYGRNYPQHWIAELARLGLDVRGLVALPDRQDHRTFFAYTASGERVDTQPAMHFARIDRSLPPDLHGYEHSTPGQDDPAIYEPLALRPADWPAAYNGATAVHLAPLPLATHLNAPSALRAANVKVITIDPGERYMIPERLPFIRRLLPQIDAFLPSDQEVRSLFGRDVALWDAAQQLVDWGAPRVVIKAGADGVLLLDGLTGHRHALPAYHKAGDPHVKDVTGAGDAFCGGFIAGIAKIDDSYAAAQKGLVSASLVIEGYGGLFALGASPKTAEARLRALRRRQAHSVP